MEWNTMEYIPSLTPILFTLQFGWNEMKSLIC